MDISQNTSNIFDLNIETGSSNQMLGYNLKSGESQLKNIVHEIYEDEQRVNA